MARRVEREAVFHREFREDLLYWLKTDRKAAFRTLELVEAAMQDPFTGIGKPEPLKFVLAGCWSRRITQEHRLVYRVSERRIDFSSGSLPLLKARKMGSGSLKNTRFRCPLLSPFAFAKGCSEEVNWVYDGRRHQSSY